MIKKNSYKKYYECSVCKRFYKTKELARDCKAWCEKHKNSCNIEIIKYAVEI